MSLINWSDSEEMLGLLSDYVSDARGEAKAGSAREAFLAELAIELHELTERVIAMSSEETIARLREICDSQRDFADDPVLTHVAACIEELERIEIQIR